MNMRSINGGVMEGQFDPARTPYEIDEHMFPYDGSPEDQYTFLLGYAVLAPSSFNTQPWKFEVREEGIAVYADYTRRLPVADPGNRELLMGVGAAIFNLRVAAEHFGFTAGVNLNQIGDSEQPLAFVSLTQALPRQSPDVVEGLFASITTRHTNRNPFLVTRIPETVLSTLRILSEGTQVSVSVCTDGGTNQQVADLVAAADRLQCADPFLRQEHAEWVHPNWSKQVDGIPGAALGVKGMTSLFTPWATKVLDRGRQRGVADRNLCAQAPGLVVLSSEDAPHLWVQVGEVLEHLLLAIIKGGLQYSFFNMPIEVPELRTRLRGTLGLHAWPQLLLRIGYCLEPATATPRRPLQEVIVTKDRAIPGIHLS